MSIEGISVKLRERLRLIESPIQTLLEESVPEEAKVPTKVFISYSWDSEDHKERVLTLANTLRKPWGIESDIDQYVRAKPPFTPVQGWDLWMEKRIEWAEFVLIVCTETYKRRFRGDEEPGVGRGSTWEGTIIRQHLYNNHLTNTKFIPVVFSSQDLTHVPTIFNGNDKYITEDEKSLGELCYRLRKEPIIAMPEIATAKLPAPPEPKFFSSQKLQAEPPPVLLDVAEIQGQNAVQQEVDHRKKLTDALTKDCIQLEILLKVKKWKEADDLTRRIVLMNDQEDRLTALAIRQLPLDLLDRIDRIWMEHGNEKFGLRVQRQLWQKILEPEKKLRLNPFAKKAEPLTESQAWNRFGYLVGWRSENEKLLPDAKLDFSTEAPPGCFPRTRLWLLGGHGNTVKQFVILMEKVAQLR